jgi:murein DD-endopeptidase MepM/ murein hydrolase activator NlpD
LIQFADLFIGSHPLTQGFGLNPASYARFGIKGHNGLDFGMDTGTEIWSATDGIVLRAGDFTGTNFNGFGVLVEIWDDVQRVACLYGHLQRPLVAVGQRVHARQPIALSDNTGNSTGPHLHFGVCATDAAGVRLNTGNGYGGWLNASEPPSGPSDGTAERFHWTFTNTPWRPAPPDDPLAVCTAQLATARAELAGVQQTAEAFRAAIAAIRVKAAELEGVIPPP